MADLVSRLRSSQREASDARKDVVGGLDPHERLGMLVGGCETHTDRILQCARAAVAAASNLLLGERGEPAFHLVDPGRVGGREMHLEAWVPGLVREGSSTDRRYRAPS